MKTFYIITCLLMLALSQQVVYAQQAPTEDFVKLEMPLEDILTKITFMVTWSSGDGNKAARGGLTGQRYPFAIN